MLSHKACMIDLETLGLDKKAVICSVAAVTCDLGASSFKIEDVFMEQVEWRHRQSGRVIEGEAVAWWFDQKPEARNLLLQLPRIELHFVLAHLKQFITSGHNPPKTLWSKGSNFDLEILSTYYMENEGRIPWSYRQAMCFRTISALFPDNLAPPEQKIKHSAYGDAVFQMEWLYNIYQFHQGMVEKEEERARANEQG